MNKKDIGRRIKEKRQAKELSREKLAEYTDLSVPYIGMIERGEKLPKLETFIAIANILDASADELLFGVIKNGYAARMSEYYKRMCKLSSDNQKLLNDIMEVFFRDIEGDI